jgi:hypothetical protein
MEQFEQHVIQQSASAKSEILRGLFPIQTGTFVQIISGFDTGIFYVHWILKCIIQYYAEASFEAIPHVWEWIF